MTLKKLLKRIPGDELIEIFDPNPSGTKLHFGYKKDVNPHYMDMIVRNVFANGNMLCINVKTPNKKLSTNNKAYKKWMKKYVKEHLDEIGLKDGGYAGDNVDDLKKFVDAYKDLSYKSGIKISSDKVSVKEKKPCEYAMECPITGNYQCVKWMFIECDCEYMRIESPVCVYCDKQIEG